MPLLVLGFGHMECTLTLKTNRYPLLSQRKGGSNMQYLRIWIYSLLVMSFLGSGSVALAQDWLIGEVKWFGGDFARAAGLSWRGNSYLSTKTKPCIPF